MKFELQELQIGNQWTSEAILFIMKNNTGNPDPNEDEIIEGQKEIIKNLWENKENPENQKILKELFSYCYDLDENLENDNDAFDTIMDMLDLGEYYDYELI